jgi:glycosyltransferase involved in cell wall biosynthesis
MPSKPKLHVDLFHYGMVKASLHDADPSLLRGVNRVASEYAMRPEAFEGFSEVLWFGSRLPSITAVAFAASGASTISMPQQPSVREKALDAINRLERRLKGHKGFSEFSRKALAGVRLLARVNLMRDFYTPAEVRSGDLWLTICTHLTSEVRALPATRVVVCHDLNHVFHYREMGLASQATSPLENNGLDVWKDEWVICVSGYTRKCFLDHHVGFPPEQVFVVPLGSDLGGKLPAEASASVLEEFGLSPGRFFLTLAAGAKHKNSSYIVEEFTEWLGQEASRKGTKLVLVGAGQDMIRNRLSPRALAAADEGHIVFTGFVADKDLPALYGGSLAFVFASLAEGFGLPPLEAMAHGAPVLCSDRTSLPEVVGDAGLLFDPTLSGNLTELFNRISDDEGLRENLRYKGKLRASEYTWERSARELATTLRRISDITSARKNSCCVPDGSGASAM